MKFLNLLKPVSTIWVACLFIISACATAQENSDQGQRIIAIGDLHGDYDAYEALLSEAGLINSRGKWAGENTIFVQTGDVPDRGPDSRKIMKHLQKLQKQAPKDGGKVITLVGNHEAMNVIGDLRYVHPGEYEAFVDRKSKAIRDATYEANRDSIEEFYLARDATLSSEAIRQTWMDATPLGKLEHQRAWRPDGELGEWVVENPAVAIVNGNLFVHGGISEKYTAFTVDEINAESRIGLMARSNKPMFIINDGEGPLWYRGLVQRDPPPAPSVIEEVGDASEMPAPETERLSIKDEVALVLREFNVKRVIVGHTPARDGIKATQGGRVIQIDTGIAEHYGGSQSFLEIIGERYIAHDNGVVRELGPISGEDE
ncbi:MAG: protein-tyrosine-phosphatase [Marinicaulis sp.]|nr:protein-tyrosine-phosphatase [Marinicaulis sp.]